MNRLVPVVAIGAMSILAIIAAPSKEAPQENRQLKLEQTEAPPVCNLAEGFGDIGTLVSAGWFMQNNSMPLGGTGWYQGNPAAFTSQSGAPNSYVAGDFNNGSGAATISNWLLTPTLQLQNGGVMTFWTRTTTSPPLFPDRLQVRMSTNGTSTNVGTTATSVGDFSTVLLDINPTYADGYPHNWTQYTVTLSGLASPTTGRLAFRYFVENGGPAGARSNYIGIDTMAYVCSQPTPTPTPPPAPTLGNYPNTSIPLSTNTTVTPDATPSNTGEIDVLTSIDFKGKLEGNPTTGVVRVTNAHPAGTYTVTVRASGPIQTTMKSFSLAVTTPATCYPASFTVVQQVSVANEPASVAVGDFNRDGNQDLAVTNSSSSNISTLLGDGAGNFGGANNFNTVAFSVAVGDFNGDGNQDLAVTNSEAVSILLGDGAGHFGNATQVAAVTYPANIAVGDFNGDRWQDLVVTDYSGFSILLGRGAGQFSAPSQVDIGTSGTGASAVVCDFDGDGKQDLAATWDDSGRLFILRGNGAGGFNLIGSFSTGAHPRCVAVGDFNRDGKEDFAVGNQASNNVVIFLGDGAGHFTYGSFGPCNFPLAIAVGDFTGDGRQDLAVAGQLGNVSMLVGDGTGAFRTPFMIGSATGVYFTSIAVGDFNGDGKQDLAEPNRETDKVSILLRDCALTPISLISRKTHGSAGDFDINLGVTGNPGIECRTTGRPTNDHTLIVTIPSPATVGGNPQAAVTLGTGTIGSNGVSNGGMVSINGNAVTIPLTNVTDVQTIDVTLFQVNGGGNMVVHMGLLSGDVNGGAVVNSADAQLTRNRSGQLADPTNFRSDVNTDGAINSADAIIVRSRSGISLP